MINIEVDNKTIYLSQNTTNAYSESTNKQTISTTNAMVIEYESSKPIIPSEVDLYQQSSYPDPAQVIFQTTLGAGINLSTRLSDGLSSGFCNSFHLIFSGNSK